MRCFLSDSSESGGGGGGGGGEGELATHRPQPNALPSEPLGPSRKKV